MTCPHPDRHNVLSLPSMGNPHCCQECWDARTAGLTQYKGKREAWQVVGDPTQADYHFDGRTLQYETTSGLRTVHVFNHGERFK